MLERLRSFQEADIEALLPLFAACEEEDQSGSVPTEETLRHQLAIPGFDVERHVHVLPDADGSLIAFCVGVPLPDRDGYTFQVSLMVRPDYRTGTLQDDLLEYVERQAVAWQAQTGQSAVLGAGVS